MRKILTVLLAAALLLNLTGCGLARELAHEVLGELPTPTPEATATPEPTPEATPEPETDYYEFIETLVPELGEASISAEIPIGSNTQIWSRYAGEIGGIISADVRDYDGDGVRDLLLLVLAEHTMGETTLAGLVYQDESPCLALEARLYTSVNGEIILSDTVKGVAEMEDMSWGGICAAVQVFDGVPYLYAACDMEDSTTYGARPSTIHHVENGKFVFDRIGGRIGWGQGSYDGDPNPVVGALGREFTKEQWQCITGSFNALEKYEENGEPLCFAEGFKPLCRITMQRTNRGISVVLKDDSMLGPMRAAGEAEVLAACTPIPTPTPAPVYEGAQAEIETLASEISEASGLTLTLSDENISETEHMAWYTAPNGCKLTLCFDTATRKPTTIRVDESGSSASPEWTAMKDGVLSAPSLGFDPDLTAEYRGNCGFNHGMPEDIGGGATAIVANAGSSVVIIQWA